MDREIRGWEKFARVARPSLRDASHSSQKRDEWGTQFMGAANGAVEKQVLRYAQDDKYFYLWRVTRIWSGD
ncbi:MAG: hypothetical protein P4L10_01705 [Acidobacteriaceae bacterium]|nr:hypothetical protein [Acidobacteriaceae bacterium]